MTLTLTLRAEASLKSTHTSHALQVCHIRVILTSVVGLSTGVCDVFRLPHLQCRGDLEPYSLPKSEEGVRLASDTLIGEDTLISSYLIRLLIFSLYFIMYYVLDYWGLGLVVVLVSQQLSAPASYLTLTRLVSRPLKLCDTDTCVPYKQRLKSHANAL